MKSAMAVCVLMFYLNVCMMSYMLPGLGGEGGTGLSWSLRGNKKLTSDWFLFTEKWEGNSVVLERNVSERLDRR